MKVRSQRIHCTGFSNRVQGAINPVSSMKDVFERSFNKSKSQYHQSDTKLIKNDDQIPRLKIKNNKKHSETINIYCNIGDNYLNSNQLNPQQDKYYHLQQENQRLNRNLRRPYMHKKFQSVLNPLLLDFGHKLNSQLPTDLRKLIKNKQINMSKLQKLKQTFVMTNRKRKNLKPYFDNYKNDQGILDAQGLQKMIKQYGYSVNDKQIEVIFQLNRLHRQGNNVDRQQLVFQLDDFVNLMSKQNIYFKTLKQNSQDILLREEYKFSAPQFQIFRNKFPKLKEALKIYKQEKITYQIFEKIMKKLDINDLVIKKQNRENIFKQFTVQKDELNPEKLLNAIVIQQNERIQSSGIQLGVKNINSFQDNLKANQQFKYIREMKDPLSTLLYPVNIKKASFHQFQKHMNSAKHICRKLKQIKQSSQNGLTNQIFKQNQLLSKQNLFNKIQKTLKSKGFNFNKNEYNSFLAFLDFDVNNFISKQSFQNYVLKQTEKQMVNRLDRRQRLSNPQKNQNLKDQQNQEQNNMIYFHRKLRSKSCLSWNSTKKEKIRRDNLSQFKVPTKYSAWPQRLYQIDHCLIQAKDHFGMGISQNIRFCKDQKHSFGQEDKLLRQQKYQNRIKAKVQWRNFLSQRIEVKKADQQNKLLSKQYNHRLAKEQYESRCRNNSIQM